MAESAPISDQNINPINLINFINLF